MSARRSSVGAPMITLVRFLRCTCHAQSEIFDSRLLQTQRKRARPLSQALRVSLSTHSSTFGRNVWTWPAKGLRRVKGCVFVLNSSVKPICGTYGDLTNVGRPLDRYR
jgi:hypothetical protein